MRRCGFKGWSCGRMCRKVLTCTVHVCEENCHEGTGVGVSSGRGCGCILKMEMCTIYGPNCVFCKFSYMSNLEGLLV